MGSFTTLVFIVLNFLIIVEGVWVRNRATSLCLSLGDSEDNQVTVAICSTSFNHKWGFAISKDGHYVFGSHKDGRCLRLDGPSDIFVVQRECDSSSAFVDQGHGVLRHVESGKCLAVNSEDRLLLGNCDKQDEHVRWNALQDFPDPGKPVAVGEEFRTPGVKSLFMRSSASGKCVDEGFTPVKLTECRNQSSQIVKRETVLVGTVLWDRVVFNETRNCLTINRSNMVVSASCSENNENQFWRMNGVGMTKDGRELPVRYFYTLMGRRDNLCLTDYGRVIGVSRCKGSENQRWSLNLSPK